MSLSEAFNILDGIKSLDPFCHVVIENDYDKILKEWFWNVKIGEPLGGYTRADAETLPEAIRLAVSKRKLL